MIQRNRAPELEAPPWGPSAGTSWLDRACVIVPAYQAEKTLAGVLADLRLAIPALAGEVFVVDDGSTDGTADVARRAGCHLFTHPTNRGKGAALATGLAAARARAVTRSR